jgi:hypothetical protein
MSTTSNVTQPGIQLDHLPPPDASADAPANPGPARRPRASSEPVAPEVLASLREVGGQSDGAARTARPEMRPRRHSLPSRPQTPPDVSRADDNEPLTTTLARADAGRQQVTTVSHSDGMSALPDIEAGSLHASTQPNEASLPLQLVMQMVRHLGPVGLTRFVAQGLVAPAAARNIVENPPVALGTQIGLAVFSLAHRAVSQAHSEQHPELANAAFAGDVSEARNSAARRLWQGFQTLGISGADVACLTLVAWSRHAPAPVQLTQTLDSILFRARVGAHLREAARPLVNTLEIVSRDPAAERPANGRNLRQQDFTVASRVIFGSAAMLLELGSQIGMQHVLNGQSVFEASRLRAAAAGVIAATANMVVSSIEDMVLDHLSVKRMRETDPSHAVVVHWESRSPLHTREFARQWERVDARVFNLMVPALIAVGVSQVLQHAQHGVDGQTRLYVEAVIYALASGVVLGALLPMTARNYQLNDDLRSALHQDSHWPSN